MPQVYAPSTFGTTVNTDGTDPGFTNHSIYYFTATSNFTLETPSNPGGPKKITWIITQDATGNRTITLGSGFKAGPFSVTLTTSGTKTDILTALYNPTDQLWYIIEFLKGY